MPPVPVQLPLFAEAASLIRVRPERNEWRFYRMEVWPDLFGRALLLRQWGRIGAGWIRIRTQVLPSMRSPASQGGSAAADTRSGAYVQITPQEVDQTRHAGAAAADRHGASGRLPEG